MITQFRILSFLFLAGLISHGSWGQIDFNPQSPIDHPLIYAGSYGELRSTHFHTGIDIKSSKWNTSGDPIYAVEEGYVSRIYVNGDGYGKAIYIDHPAGYTSVYAHLDRYTDFVEQYVISEQYRLASFVVNLFPDSTQFRVRKGELIGYMGNTGRSTAPHLHFEIRHTQSEKTVNPYRFNLGPDDTRPPTLLNLNIVHLLPDTTIVDTDRYAPIHLGNGKYRLPMDTLEVNAWRAGIEINGFDRMNGAPNKNGIYELKMLVNGRLSYHYRLDSLSFDEFRHIMAHINYTDYDELKRRYQRCYVLPGDPLNIYQPVDTALSIVPLYEKKKQNIRLIAMDYSGNEATLEFWLKRKAEITPPPPLNYNYRLETGRSHLIRLDSVILFIPDSSLYQNSYLHIQAGDTVESPLASRQVFIHNNNVFKNPVDLFIKPAQLPDSLLKKACIVSCGEKDLISYGGDPFEGYLTTKIRHYGDFAVFLDTVPPTITPILFSETWNQEMIRFKLSDNLETAGNARGIRYDGYINGKWVLFEYDAKTRTITHYFDKNTGSGEHLLRLEVLDDRDNKTIFEQKFLKK
jgi:hypothetical protein